MAKTPFPKSALDSVTKDNLAKVTQQAREIILELQGTVGPEGLRAVRLEELTKIGLLKSTPNGYTIGDSVGTGSSSSGGSTGSYVFDGGGPSAVYVDGPVFDCGKP